MKTKPHPHYDLFDHYPELRPGPDRDPLSVLVKRKRRPKDAKEKRGDVDFYFHCVTSPDGNHEQVKVNLYCKSANPFTAAEYLKLLIRDLKPQEVLFDDNAAEVKALMEVK